MVHFLFSRLRYAEVCIGSYILQLCSFVASLISLMIGTSVLIIYDTCYANDRVLKVRILPSYAF